MILLAYRHGLRASEVCDLQWHQVELQNDRAMSGSTFFTDDDASRDTDDKNMGPAVPIAVISGCKVKGDTKASAIRRVPVVICRIGVGSRVPTIASAVGVAPIRVGS